MQRSKWTATATIIAALCPAALAADPDGPKNPEKIEGR
jgi:hypothetical protein